MFGYLNSEFFDWVLEHVDQYFWLFCWLRILQRFKEFFTNRMCLNLSFFLRKDCFFYLRKALHWKCWAWCCFPPADDLHQGLVCRILDKTSDWWSVYQKSHLHDLTFLFIQGFNSFGRLPMKMLHFYYMAKVFTI